MQRWSIISQRSIARSAPLLPPDPARSLLLCCTSTSRAATHCLTTGTNDASGKLFAHEVTEASFGKCFSCVAMHRKPILDRLFG